MVFYFFKKRRHRKRKKQKNNHAEYVAYKLMALEIAHCRIIHFNRIYQCPINKITVRNQKTRWGSCSKKGNLNFNYKIALLPQNLSDYIIIHELCHLKEFNHSRRFWNLVAKTIPHYKEIKKRFKKIPIVS